MNTTNMAQISRQESDILTGQAPMLSGADGRVALSGLEPELSGLRAAMQAPLIVHSDDEPMLMHLVARLLDMAGYRVESMPLGADVLRFTKQVRPDLIMKPEMSGLELLSRLKGDAARKDIPIIMLTASGSPSIIAQAFEMGANAYLVKPFAPNELIDVVRGLLPFAEMPA